MKLHNPNDIFELVSDLRLKEGVLLVTSSRKSIAAEGVRQTYSADQFLGSWNAPMQFPLDQMQLVGGP